MPWAIDSERDVERSTVRFADAPVLVCGSIVKEKEPLAAAVVIAVNVIVPLPPSELVFHVPAATPLARSCKVAL